MKTPFAFEGDRFRVALDADETEILATLPGYLEGVGADRSDPAASRLLPEAHVGDAAAERRYRELVASGLRRSRRDDRAAFAESLRRADRLISLEEAEAWVRVMGDARLALAARAGVVRTGNDEWEQREPTDPELALAHYLGYLQGELVEAMLEALGADTHDF